MIHNHPDPLALSLLTLAAPVLPLTHGKLGKRRPRALLLFGAAAAASVVIPATQAWTALFSLVLDD